MTHTITYPECNTILNIKDELRNTCCHGHEVFAMLIGYIPCIYSVYFNFQFLIYVINVSATYYFRKHFTYSTRILLSVQTVTITFLSLVLLILRYM